MTDQRDSAQEDGAHALFRAARQAMGPVPCFANPGTSEMQLVSALDDDNLGIQPNVLVLQENVATGAADGYARMTKSPALVLLHLGPGLANGVANLHNARRARSPIVLVIGDFATWHKGADPFLNSNIITVAKSVSSKVLHFTDENAATSNGGGNGHKHDLKHQKSKFRLHEEPGEERSRIVTVIVPQDASWGPANAFPAEETMRAALAAADQPSADKGGNVGDAQKRLCADAAAAIKREMEAGGKVALYLGGSTLASEEALKYAGRIAEKTGATLLCEGMIARAERGEGLPHLARIPYFPVESQEFLQQYSMFVFVDAVRPVASFANKEGISQLITHVDEGKIWEFDGQLPVQSLRLIAQELGAADAPSVPGKSSDSVFCSPNRPALPSGKLTAEAACTTLAALQPEHAIIVDESFTSGGAYWDASKGVPRFTHLAQTGAAIGMGPCVSVGAAVACPDRLVLNLQADGSAMYTFQALWTQARQQLNVITIICDNNHYHILEVETGKQQLPEAGPATKALTFLGQPGLDWVGLAQGLGVPAVKVTTSEQLAEVLKAAIERCTAAIQGGAAPQHAPELTGTGGKQHSKGPFLIQACLQQ